MAPEVSPATRFTDEYGRTWRLLSETKKWQLWDPGISRWMNSDVPPPGYRAAQPAEAQATDAPPGRRPRRSDPTELFVDPFGSKWRFDAAIERWECWSEDGRTWMPSDVPPPGLPGDVPKGRVKAETTRAWTIFGVVAIVAAVVLAVVLGIWAFHHFTAKSTSYHDGAAAAGLWITQDASLLVGQNRATFPTQECTVLAQRQRPSKDDRSQWIQGCADTLSAAMSR